MANKYWNPSSSGTPTQSAAPTYTPAPAYTPPPKEEKPGFFERLGTKLSTSPFLGKAMNTKVGSGVMKGLGWLGEKMNSPLGVTASNVLMAPSRFISGGIKEREKEELPNFTPDERMKYNPFTSSFLKGGIESVKHPERLDPWGGGFLGKGSVIDQRRQAGREITPLEKDVGFAGEIFVPTTAELGLVKAASKIPGISKLSQKFMKPLTKWGDDVGDFIKGSKVGDVIEALEPGFKAPGAKKLLDQAKDAANLRVNQIHKKIKQMAEGLSPAQQRVVGELIEGGNKIDDIADVGTTKLYKAEKGVFGHEDFWDKGQYSRIKGFKEGDQFFTDDLKIAEYFQSDYKGKITQIDVPTKSLRPIPGRFGEYLVNQAEGINKVSKIAKKVVGVVDDKLKLIARQMNELADEVGREGVELWEMTQGKIGLNPESFEKLKGEYLPHIWNNLIKKGDAAFITEDAPKLLGNFWKKRTGKAGYIKEFAPASFKGLATQITENEIARGYIAIAEKFGLKADDAKKLLAKNGPEALKDFGYVPADVINLKTAGIFKDVQLPKEVVDFIKGSAAKAGTTTWDKAWSVHDKLLNAWKLGKTIYNPAYHVRNIISNQILANMATGGSLVETVVDSFKGMLNYMGKGSQKYVEAAENVNLIRKMSLTDNFKVLMQESNLIQKGNVQKWGSFWKNFQNSSEDIAKLSVFKRTIDDVVKVGSRNIDDILADPAVLKVAKDLAEKAIFSPYKIGSGERALMSRIIPFYSFSRQAIPFVAETAIKNPERLAKYPRFKHAVESYGGDTVPQEDRPEWQKNSIQLPWKSKSGEPIALDTSYLYPWGNLGESAGSSFGKGQLPGGISLNPFLQEAEQQIANKDFYFDRDISDSKLPGFSLKDMTSTKPRMEGSERWAHVANTILPSLYRTYFGKIKPAIGGVPDYAGRDRDVWMAVFDSFGLKTTILRPDDKRMFDLIDQRSELKEIKSQMYSVAADQRLDDNEKKKLLDAYVKEIEKLFQQ